MSVRFLPLLWGILSNIMSSYGGDDDLERPTASVWVWLGLSITAALSFYAQALVTEERFVPSLNVIATHLNLSSDVAGATLMASGASAPELFASILSLFVTHSALGLGTIVGSEIFNQLIICAGSIQAARNNLLKLDKAIIIREVFFYGMSLALLLVALSDRKPDDDDMGYNHVYISLGDGLLLLGGYILYVVTCAYFENILRFIRRLRGGIGGCSNGTAADGEELGYRAYLDQGVVGQKARKQVALDVPALPFLRQLSHEPKANLHRVLSQDHLMSLKSDSIVSDLDPSMHQENSGEGIQGPTHSVEEAERCVSPVAQRFTPAPRLLHKVLSSKSSPPKPDQLHGLTDIEKDGNNASCFLWQQSLFYNKARVDINAWHLRWTTFYSTYIESIPNRRDYSLHKLRYGGISDLEVDEDHLVLRFVCTLPEKREFILMAPSRKVLETAVAECERILGNQNELQNNFGSFDSFQDIGSEAEEVRSLLEFPATRSPLSTGLHITLLPIKALTHYTVPDVRILPVEKSWMQLRQAIIAMCSCLLWIVLGSLAMCTSLERLGRLMGISDMLMGVTVSAAGTSLPVLVASQVAAAQGLGKMAVSNAFGANVFNIFIGLGLPWALYCGFVTKGETYHDLRDDGITISTLILAAALLSFVLLIIASNFVLHRWHAYVFVAMYMAYLVYVITEDVTTE